MKSKYTFVFTTVFLLAFSIYAKENETIPLSFEGFSMEIPFFSDKGELSHILYAEKASRGKNNPKLEGVQIIFFKDGDPGKSKGKISTSEAIYHPIHKTIRGNDIIKLESPECHAEGIEFHADLVTKIVTIKRNCVASLSGLEIKSEQAIFDFQKISGADRKETGILKSLTAKGEVVVINHGNTAYDFDMVNTQLAIYEPITSTITMPDEIRILKDRTSAKMGKLVIKTKETEPVIDLLHILPRPHME